MTGHRRFGPESPARFLLGDARVDAAVGGGLYLCAAEHADGFLGLRVVTAASGAVRGRRLVLTLAQARTLIAELTEGCEAIEGRLRERAAGARDPAGRPASTSAAEGACGLRRNGAERTR